MTLTLKKPEVEQRILLHNVSWETYEGMLRAIGDGHVRLAYDQGRLEIMSPGEFHETVKSTVRRLLEAYADEHGIDVEGYGSTTYRRAHLEKGLEPDECYYIAHAAETRGRDDVQNDPDLPPDLAIEIDISPPRLSRQPIYAALNVPEIWRFDGRALECLRRAESPSGATYVVSERSLSFPSLIVADLNQFIELSTTQSQSAAVRAFRQWMRG
jgi:Uma2 family endonuclease